MTEEEVTKLFQKLFHDFNKITILPLIPGKSGAKIVKVFLPQTQNYVVVKFDYYDRIKTELDNYEKFIVRLARQYYPDKWREAYTENLGGILYAFLRTSVDNFSSFNSYYQRNSNDEIKTAINFLFEEVLVSCFRGKGAEDYFNLADLYRKHLKIPNNPTLESEIFTDQLSGYYGQKDIKFPPQPKTFPNPVYFIEQKEKDFCYCISLCITHGDLNGNNILLDPQGHTWLIDFFKTGPGHILQDLIKLETVIKFELLETGDMQALYEFEDALFLPTTFKEFDQMTFKNSFNKNDLEKAFEIIKELRRIAKEIVGFGPRKAEEYYIGLLYQTLIALTWKDVRRQHAFLSAAMICDKLK